MSENEAINVRTTRINHLILGRSEATSKVSKAVTEALSREGLLDALCLLYNECDKEFLKKRDRNVFDFVNKYRDIIKETNNLRVNINDFCVKSLIGKGYFGEVHLASEKSTKDIYAIKKIRKSQTSSSQIKEERDIMACQNSEWVTSLQYAFQDRDNLYLVMEYLPGGDLLSLMIRNGAFDEELARFYLAEMTLALNALHQMGYVHRDIKPENILLDRFGHLKLADFGNAAPLNKDGNVISMSPVGTPDYIAPELLQTLSTMNYSKSVHDVTCDFWSMGIIGYEFLTEVTPFHEENVHETYSKILSHVDAQIIDKLQYPNGLDVSRNFRNLIDGLVTKKSKRFTYQQIVQHPYFEGIEWDNIRHQVPPIIPSLSGEDDTSNFEDVDKKGRRSTFTKSKPTTFMKGNDFSGQHLPFIGYSYVHEESENYSITASPARISSDKKVSAKLSAKLSQLQITVDEQMTDIKTLQHQLLTAQRKSAQTESLEKILLEAKHELTNMKDKLKEKTIELAACKTDNKTLKSSLKIEEDMRLKNDANISEVLNSTYQKWEKAKKLSEQNYEKQIAEKKTEITSLAQTLQVREHELNTKVDECKHIQERLQQYKELLKSTKEQTANDKIEFDNNKKKLIDAYEQKVQELKVRVQQKEEARIKSMDELRALQRDLNESICSTQSISQSKLAADKNIEDIKSRMNRQIEENKAIREDKANADRKIVELQKRYDEVVKEVERLQHTAQKQLHSSQQLEHLASRRSSGGGSELYRSAQGSLESITSGIEDQLRNDLLMAKEKEHLQRKRADRLEEAVGRLEEAINRLQPKPGDNLLERKNEKLEDQLASVREQAIVERQASRTAHLSLYKLEKQIEDFTLEKKLTARRLEQAEEKFTKLREEKEIIERQLHDNLSTIKSKEERITELHNQIQDLKIDVKKEHSMWEKAEYERIKDKSEIIEHVSRMHQLEERLLEQKRKVQSLEQRSDTLTLENKRLIQEKSDANQDLCNAEDTISELETELHSVQRNYEMLKEACTIMETQLTELEAMHDSEAKQNRSSSAKNDELWNKMRERDTEITMLRQSLNEQSAAKIASETKCNQLQTEIGELNDTINTQTGQLLEHQEHLIRKTTALFESQENVEVLTSDLANLQRISENYARELHILKEENSKVLTDLFLVKEDLNNINMDRKECHHKLAELKKELEQLNGTLAEQKNYYMHRDIKSEATLAQYKKLITYLQQRVDELTQKKKKSFTEVLFGTNTSKKENIPPGAIEESLIFKRVQEDLVRERSRNAALKEELENVKGKSTTEKNNREKIISGKNSFSSAPPQTENVRQSSSDNGNDVSCEKRLSQKRRSYQTHRFEMTLENNSADYPYTACLVCQKEIMVGHTYLKCKECKCAAHRRCRGDVQTSCTGEDILLPSRVIAQQEQENDSSENNSETSSEQSAPSSITASINKKYFGDVVLHTSDLSPPLLIHCVYEIMDDILLLGAESGLYSFNQQTKQLVHISGITCVTYIAVNTQLSKCVLVGAQGEHLYLCDLRHLQSRAQASASLKPKLDASVLELPCANRVSSERWQYVVLSGTKVGHSYIIACTSSRLVILRFDNSHNRFKPVCALDTAKPVSCILFTSNSVIVSSDKFFEIDLQTFQAEEFLDGSDMSCIEARTCSHPVSVFKINSQEFLLCFKEFGIFVDNYGDRARPENINWANRPTGFTYRDPLLFVTYSNMVEVVRIQKSYTNECDHKRRVSDGEADENEIRSFITMNRPRIMGSSGKLGVFLLTKSIGSSGGECGDDLILVDGIKSLKSFMSSSLETLLSSMMSIPRGLAGSSETLSTINNNSDNS